VTAVVLVVPCYNEAERLDVAAWTEGLTARPYVRPIWVDDGSTDATASRLEALAAQTGGSVLRLASNTGKAEAVRTGVLAAFAEGASVVGYFDADLATPLDALEGLLERLEGDPHAWLAAGSRQPRDGAVIERRWLRHHVGRLAAAMAAWVLGVRFYDTQCGAKLFRAVPPVRAAFAQPFTVTWTFDVELLVRLLDAPDGGPHRLLEVPLARWRDVPVSKVRWTDALHAPWALLGVWWRRQRKCTCAARPRSP
jgi:glycosyltransferase involved in cell wall biosynthesis